VALEERQEGCVRMKRFFVYILASEGMGRSTLASPQIWCAAFGNTKRRSRKGSTSRYNVVQLVYYQEFGTAYDAITKEKQIKKWNRSWK